MDGRVRRATVATLLLTMVACGGGGATGTGATASATAGPGATDAPRTPSAGATTEESPTTAPVLSSEERSCVDAFMAYLVDIERFVDGFDYAGMTILGFQGLILKLVPAGEALADRASGMRCDVLDGTPPEELLPIMVDIARIEAPGSVRYLELLIASSELKVAGSCRKDIAALQRYVDAGGTVRDVSVEGRFHAFGLVASVSATCDLMTGGRYLSSSEMERFLEIG